MEIGRGEIPCRLERDLRPSKIAIKLRVASAIEVYEVQSCGGVCGEWVGTKWARVFFFPFACVSEHTWFAEATEMNRVR